MLIFIHRQKMKLYFLLWDKNEIFLYKDLKHFFLLARSWDTLWVKLDRRKEETFSSFSFSPFLWDFECEMRMKKERIIHQQKLLKFYSFSSSYYLPTTKTSSWGKWKIESTSLFLLYFSCVHLSLSAVATRLFWKIDISSCFMWINIVVYWFLGIKFARMNF